VGADDIRRPSTRIESLNQPGASSRGAGCEQVPTGMETKRSENDPRRRAGLFRSGIVATGIALIAIMWTVVAASLVSERDDAVERARSDGANLAAAFQDQVTHTLDGVAGAMELVATRMRGDGPAFNIYEWAREIPLMAASTSQGAIIGPDGKLLSTTLSRHAEPVDLGDREHFRIHLDGTFKGLFISKPVIGRVSKKTTIQISKRIEAADGGFLGVLVFSLAPEELTTLHKSVDLGERGVIALVGLDGIIRARFVRTEDPGSLGIGAALPEDTRATIAGDSAAGTYSRESVVDHVTRLYNYRRVAPYPLVVVVGLETDRALAAVHAQARLLISLAAAATLLLGGLAAFLMREIGRRAEREVELASERSKLQAANAELAAERVKLEAANSELMMSKEHAEAASQAKSLFLANMSHELRTPLNAIIGFSQLIRDQRMGPVGIPLYAEYAADILGAGEHLLEVINNILDISKIEAGKLELVEEWLPLQDIVRSSLASVYNQAQVGRVALETNLPADLPPIRADRVMLRQILINLLANAVKFTPPGGRVAVAAERTADGGLAIAIADTGIGMSRDEIVIALEPFRQVENSLTKRHAGTGLGLPLANRLAELHGGHLAIESAKGNGTTIRLHLPADRVTPPAEAGTLAAD
jgi:signal transduction histidine kinase